MWAVALDMAKGDPLRAKEIYSRVDRVWYHRWIVWRKENIAAKVPDYIVGMYQKE